MCCELFQLHLELEVRFEKAVGTEQQEQKQENYLPAIQFIHLYIKLSPFM